MNSKLLALAALIIASILVSGCTSQNPNSTGQAVAATAEKVKITFEITANEKTDNVTVFVSKGINAFEAMKANLKVDYKDSAMGPFITGINNVTADSEHYWALYVDGSYASKGINQYSVDKETTIAWKLEKIDFSKFS